MTKQLATTLMYVVVAVVVLAGAWLAQSASTVAPVVNDVGERFFPEFDPLDAKAIEIVRINEEEARPVTFRVAQTGGVWSIPSHENYPADGGDRLAQVAASVMDVTKGAIISDNPADHALLGVADPSAENADATAGAAGTRIKLENASGKALVDLIVGKAVKDAPGVHYVRTPGRDRVYTAKIDIGNVSTRFEDWIEGDLLQLTPADVRSVIVDDYSIDEINRTMVQGELVELTRTPDPSSPWAPGTWSLKGIKANEQVNEERVRELTTALSDLRIVDVHRKPAGLSEQLAGDGGLTLDAEAVSSLAARGFYISGNQLLANEGQTVVRMSDGVEYVLRFGEIALYKEGKAAESGHDDKSLSDELESSEEETNPGRYVFVSAAFNKSAVPLPELKPVPELPADDSANSEVGPPTAEEAANQEATRSAAQAERDRIIAANEKAQKDYDEKCRQGEERAKKLAARFAPWYYIVPDSVYQKIRLTRADVVQPKTADDAAGKEDSLPTPMIEPSPEE